MNAIEHNSFTQSLNNWGKANNSGAKRPSLILMLSAHFMTPGETVVNIQANPKTIHDFGGFPPELHAVQYPAPGSPELAKELQSIIKSRKVGGTNQWGLDHGAWSVLRLIYPDASIPVVQLSIDYAQKGAFHHTIGRELAALREKGVLIVGSGNFVHNLRQTAFDAAPSEHGMTDWAEGFDVAVKAALDERSAKNDDLLLNYEKLHPGARIAVPTPDHYWPFLYALGAAEANEKAKYIYTGFQNGTLSMRCVQFG